MTPLLLLAILATPTTPPATINPPHTPTKEATMAQGNPNLSFPTNHPIILRPGRVALGYQAPGPGHRGAAHGYPNNGRNTIANMPMPAPVEHTNRPR